MGTVVPAVPEAAQVREGIGVNYERKVDSMDSLAGTQSYYQEADDGRRKRTFLIVALVLIALALAATYYAFTHGKGAADAEG